MPSRSADMSAPDLAPLFDPITINGTRFPNRLVQSAMYSRYATTEGEVSERHLAYMDARAQGGVGLIITEDLVVEWATGRGSGAPLRVDDDLMVPGLAELAETVHRRGAKIAGQIYHAGRQSDHRTRQLLAGIASDAPPPLSASDIPSRAIVDRPRPMTIGEIEAMVERFGDAARRLVQAGFDAVEVHAVHGYLLTQFFSPESNRRTDDYGGSLENRARFVRQVVRRVREVVGPGFPIICRLSADERVPGAASVEDNMKLAAWLAEDGVDIFNVSAGTYDSREWVYTPPGVEQGSLVPLAERVKAVTERPVMGISKLGFDLELTARFVREGRIDMAAMGRTQLADPDNVRKARAGATRNIRPCIACCECAREFIAQQRRMQCVVNPELGNEFRHLLRPSVVSRRVLVVGGGPAGLEAARAAATGGHEVTLWESADELGGLLRAAARPAFHRVDMMRLIDYWTAELERLGVAVELGRTATAADIAAHPADAVFVATGTHQRVVPSGLPDGRLRTTTEILLDGDDLGETVAILGGDEPGLNAAIYLAERGRRVTLVEAGPIIGAEISDIMRGKMISIAQELGVHIAEDCAVVEIVENSDRLRVVVERGGAAMKRGFHDVVVSGAREPVRIEGLPDDGGLPARARYLGTAATPTGRLYRATQDGYWAAVGLADDLLVQPTNEGEMHA
ncbi:MAG TPA: FAD-dependent oxidoreductase [Baekduia sp.]|nr:FAD-dependent oxidoreductase [Baekduia sp.]